MAGYVWVRYGYGYSTLGYKNRKNNCSILKYFSQIQQKNTKITIKFLVLEFKTISDLIPPVKDVFIVLTSSPVEIFQSFIV